MAFLFSLAIILQQDWTLSGQHGSLSILLYDFRDSEEALRQIFVQKRNICEIGEWINAQLYSQLHTCLDERIFKLLLEQSFLEKAQLLVTMGSGTKSVIAYFDSLGSIHFPSDHCLMIEFIMGIHCSLKNMEVKILQCIALYQSILRNKLLKTL